MRNVVLSGPAGPAITLKIVRFMVPGPVRNHHLAPSQYVSRRSNLVSLRSLRSTSARRIVHSNSAGQPENSQSIRVSQSSWSWTFEKNGGSAVASSVREQIFGGAVAIP